MSDEQVAEALAELKARDPGLRRAVVKLNEGFSGEGNAVFSFAGAPSGPGLHPWVSERLPKLGFEAEGMDWETYRAKLREMGAITEAFIEGQEKRSPSAQYRVEPDGTLDMISTHDQVLGDLRPDLPRLRIPGRGLPPGNPGGGARGGAAGCGSTGCWAGSGSTSSPWRRGRGREHHAIEADFRKGGTTHPNLMLAVHDRTGLPAGGRHVRRTYRTALLLPRVGQCPGRRLPRPDPGRSGGSCRPRGPAFRPGAAGGGGVSSDRSALGAGLGMVCVGPTVERARELFRATIAVLDRETGNTRG